MIDRSKYKAVKEPESEPVLIEWETEDDLPIYFTLEEKQQMQFKIIKKNYKIGAIPKYLYLKMMEQARNLVK